MIKKFFKNVFVPFFAKNGSVKPIRVFITCLMTLIIWAIFKEVLNPGTMNPQVLGILYGGIGLLIGADTWRSNIKTKYDGPAESVKKEEI